MTETTLLPPPKLDPERKLHKRLLRQIGHAIRDFSLIDEGDRILLALSGGKDSLALLHLLGEMMQHTNHRFTVEAMHVRMEGVDYESDGGYLAEQAGLWGIPLHIVNARFEPDRNPRRTPCFLCSWTRRKTLFNEAQRLGFNKIALGHHRDDILRTALMNLTFNGTFSTMPALLEMRKFPISIIRPLAETPEADLRLWAELKGFRKVKKICPYDAQSNRTSVQSVMDELQKLCPDYEYNLWHALIKAGALQTLNGELEGDKAE